MRSDRNQALYRLSFGGALLILLAIGEATGLRARTELPTPLMVAAGTGFIGLLVVGGLLFWMSHQGRHRIWMKYVATGMDMLTIGALGLVVTTLTADIVGVTVPAFKTPAWYLLLLVTLGPAFRFSPGLAITSAVGAGLVMSAWLIQALLTPTVAWSNIPVEDLFGDKTNSVTIMARFMITGLICRSGYLISRNARRVVTTAVQTQVGLAREQFRRERIQENMARYFPPHVASSLADGSGLPGLGGERRRLVILISDIRNFTTAAEAMDPGQAVSELNRYFTEMVDVLFQTRGTLLGFIGDGILAVYGLPEPGLDDARQAVEGARRMIERLRSLKQQGEFPGLGDFAIGIGLHVGEVMVGNIGAPQRMEFTVIGDPVNTAARVESMNKALGTSILATADVVAALGEHTFPLRPMGEHQVKGKVQTLRLFQVEAGT